MVVVVDIDVVAWTWVVGVLVVELVSNPTRIATTACRSVRVVVVAVDVGRWPYNSWVEYAFPVVVDPVLSFVVGFAAGVFWLPCAWRERPPSV